MNELIIPKGVQWYLDKIATCAPDNTLIYGAKKDLVIIYPIQPDTPPDIKCIYSAHKEQITAVAVNSKWGQPEKLAVSIGEDNIVCLWNISDCTLKTSHNAHLNNPGVGVGVTFVNSTVTSITDNCHIVVWCLRTNTARVINLKYQMNRFRITCLSTCPHNCDLSAFGTNKGIIFIMNTKGSGSILYKLRGHDHEVVSLSWCPSPYNVFNNKIDDDRTVPKINKNNEDTQFDISDYSFEEPHSKVIQDIDSNFEIDSVFVNNLVIPERTISKPKMPIDRKNPWGNLDFSDEEENNDLEISTSTNFLNESMDLKKLILDVNKEIEKANFNMADLKGTLDEISKNQMNNLEIADTNKEQHSKSYTDEISEEERDKQKIQLNINPSSESTNELEKEFEQSHVVDKEFDSILSKCAGDSVLDSEDVDSVSDLDCGIGERARSYEELTDDNKLLCTVEDIIEKSKFRESKLSASISSSLNVEIDDTSVIEDDNMKIEESSFNLDPENIEKLEIKTDDENVEDFNSNINKNKKLQRVVTGTSVETLPSNDEADNHPLLDSKYCSTSISSSLHVEVDELSNASDGNVKTEETDSLKSVNITDHSDFRREHTDSLELNDKMCLKDMLLVSGCKKSNVCIWRAGGDGRLQTSLNLNTKNKNRKNNSGYTSWTSVCWVKPNIILMSSPNGELLSWNILSNANIDTQGSKPYDLIHSDHIKSIYCIAASCSTSDQIDTPLHVWTLGQDRWLLCTDLKKQIAALPMFWGYVYFIAACPLDPHKIAIAVGDQSLRLFDLSSPHNLSISMRVVYQNIKGKVMAVAWHPEKENCLAFSTHEGRIQIFDNANVSKQCPILLSLYHRKHVYSLCWGPLNSKSKNWVLYTCADGVCVIYDPQKPSEVPTKLKYECVVNRKISEIAWNSDYDTVAVGFQDGSIMLATPDFVPIINFYENKKSIQYLCWHPNCTINDDGESQFKHWLATATSDSVVIVYDCEININEDKTIHDRKIATLKGHTMSVYKLAWSPHEGGQLVSVSLDGTALVWDVPTQTLLSTFMGHNGDGILSVLWSPFQPNLILTGGKDCTLRIWDKSKYPPTWEKPKVHKLHLKSNTKIVLPSGTLKVSNKGDDINEEGNKKPNLITTDIIKPKLSKSAMLPLTSKQQNLQGDSCIDTCRQLLNTVDKKIKAREMGKSETCDYSECTTEETINLTHNSIDHLKLFGTMNDIDALLSLEQKGHERYGRWEPYNNISLWKNDTKSMIDNSINKKTLTDWHLSMAVLIGKRYWKETCSEYAEQLIEQNEPIKAVSYLLICGKIPRALKILCEAKLYREALVLAQCRLTSDDPDINIIVKKWAEDSEYTGSYQIAAECYIFLENFEKAARIFAKKPDLNSQKLALDLAKRTNNKDLISMLEGRLKAESETEQEISDRSTNVNDVIE